MNAESLKNSILQLAIQGKLVEQREEEGTAEDLYKQIQQEKEKLIKEGKIRKQKKLPEITEEEIPFEIPETWKWVRLIDFGVTQTGNTPPRKHHENFGDYIPFISPADILNGSINYKNNGLSEIGETKGRTCNKNSILQVCIGGSIGKCAINDRYVAFNQQINSLTTIKVNYLYTYYILQSYFFYNKIKEKSTGTATPIINKSSWEMLLLPLPPLAEQKRIVEKIEELMPLVERYGKAYEEVTELNKNFPVEMEKSILQYAIQGQLVEQREEEGTTEELYKQIQLEKEKLIEEGKIRKQKGLPEIVKEEIPFEIPETWKWVRLGDVFTVLMGQSPKGKNVSEEIKGIEFHQGKKLFGEKYLLKSFQYTNSPTRVVEPNTLIMSVRAPVGDVNITEREICIGRGLCGVQVINNNTKTDFLYYLLTAIKFEFIKKSTGSTFSAITAKVVHNQVIPLPPLAEQKRIVARIEELLEYTRKLKEE